MLTFFISKPRANIYKIGRFIVGEAQAATCLGSQGLSGNHCSFKSNRTALQNMGFYQHILWEVYMNCNSMVNTKRKNTFRILMHVFVNTVP